MLVRHPLNIDIGIGIVEQLWLDIWWNVEKPDAPDSIYGGTTYFTFEKSDRVGFAEGLMDTKVVLLPLSMGFTFWVDTTKFA